MRISLEARPTAMKLNECDLASNFFLRSCSLTISYHAICVGTHVTLILHSPLDVKQFNDECHTKNKY